MAIGVLSALAAAGRRVPADVAVVSCDDMPFAEYLVPALSSLRVPFAETGERAVELLLRSIGGDPPPEGPVLLPVELIVRDSCGGQRPAAARRTASRRKATAPPAAGPPATGMPSATAARSAEKEDQ
jgi:ABC-type sugar transport system substrate-binding protein